MRRGSVDLDRTIPTTASPHSTADGSGDHWTSEKARKRHPTNARRANSRQPQQPRRRQRPP
eukprot:9006215-Pyramimonas_sp.AAC.1